MSQLFHAIARNEIADLQQPDGSVGSIPQGTHLSFNSEHDEKVTTGFTLRKEIAVALNEQLRITVPEGQEASVAAAFDIYTPEAYAQWEEKQRAEQEKQQRRTDREAARQQREEEKKNGKGKTTAKKSGRRKAVLGGLSVSQVKRLAKILIVIAVVAWTCKDSLRSCSWRDWLGKVVPQIEQTTKKTTRKTTTKKTTTTKRSSTTTAKKKTTTTKTTSSTAAKKKTTRKSTATKKKSSSTTRKNSSSAKKSTKRNSSR